MFGYPFQSNYRNNSSFADLFGPRQNQYGRRGAYYDEEEDYNSYRQAQYEQERRRQQLAHEQMELQRQQELRNKQRRQQELYRQELLRREQHKQRMQKLWEAQRQEQSDDERETEVELNEKPIDENASALRIQRVFKGYLVRKQAVLQKLKSIKAVENEVDSIVQQDTSVIGLPQDGSVPLPPTTQYVGDVPKQFLAFELALTAKLISLDGISCGSSDIARASRKALASKIEGTLAYVDILKSAYRRPSVEDAVTQPIKSAEEEKKEMEERLDKAELSTSTPDNDEERAFFEGFQFADDAEEEAQSVGPIVEAPSATEALVDTSDPTSMDSDKAGKDNDDDNSDLAGEDEDWVVLDDPFPLSTNIFSPKVPHSPNNGDIKTNNDNSSTISANNESNNNDNLSSSDKHAPIFDDPTEGFTTLPTTTTPPIMPTLPFINSDDAVVCRKIPTLKSMCFTMCDQLLKKAIYAH